MKTTAVPMKAVTMMLRRQPQSGAGPPRSPALPPFAAGFTYLGLTAMTKSSVGPRPKPERGAKRTRDQRKGHGGRGNCDHGDHTCEEGEAGQDGQSLPLRLGAVRRHAEPGDHRQGAEGRQETPLTTNDNVTGLAGGVPISQTPSPPLAEAPPEEAPFT